MRRWLHCKNTFLGDCSGFSNTHLTYILELETDAPTEGFLFIYNVYISQVMFSYDGERLLNINNLARLEMIFGLGNGKV